MNWSIEQTAIFDFFRTGIGNAVISARAGTGKTTTVKEAFNHAPEKKILYTVFNKKNQREAEAKITDPRVEVKTLHSLGYAFIKRVWSNAKPDDEVESDRVLSVAPELANDQMTCAAVLKLVGFAKNTCINATREELDSITESQDVQFNGTDGVGIALAVLEKSKVKDLQGRISFNDMVWLPVACNWVKQWFDLVCIDEAQDMNIPQLAMARGACKAGGRVVVVGDDRQAIYGFRGAASDGMGMMKVTLRAQEFSLNTTYRCPKLVVAEAQKIVPDYIAAPEAPEGFVSMATEMKMMAEIKINDVVLSRLNAPLMPLALSFIRKNIPARVEGRDIGKQLIGMVRSMKANSVPHFIERVEGWEKKQIERLEKIKKSEKRIEQTHDIGDTLKAIAEGAKNVAEIESRISNLFQDTDANSKPAVVLSTVHKAKGLEWKNVFMLSDTFRKGKGLEEDNIWYVAVTRSMHTLFFISGKGEQKEIVAPEIKPQAQVSLPELPLSAQISELPTNGHVRHQRGNIIRFEGLDWACEMVNDSRARFFCLKETYKTVSLSNNCEPQFIIRRIAESELKNFSTRETRRVESKQINAGNESEVVMAKKIKNTKVKTAGVKRSYAGRSELIAKLVAEKKTDKQIVEIVDEKYHGSSPCDVEKCIAAKRAKFARPAKADKSEKPAKKTKTPKASKPAAEVSAPPSREEVAAPSSEES